ncbi:MAG: BtpA/SgcQ family protein [Cyanobacteria bacterium]|nr:BtpA/SgcQ family protein [Cyanobacteriota bacterium]
MLEKLFATKKPIIGVIHLLPLPGSCRWSGDLEQVLQRAEQEALALTSGGVDGIVVENFFDAPFAKTSADPATIAGLTRAAMTVRAVTDLPLGINVLRNDAIAALAVAVASQAQFIRVNVLSGAMVTDQGVIESNAREVMLYRRQLGAQETVRIFADVMVKHAYPLAGNSDIASAAKDTVQRSLADAVIVSGEATGDAPTVEDIALVKKAIPNTPVLIGSGTSIDNAYDLLGVADGTIVASSLKRQGKLENPVDVERVRSLVDTVALLRMPSAPVS